jgi:hypothetical protein
MFLWKMMFNAQKRRLRRRGQNTPKPTDALDRGNLRPMNVEKGCPKRNDWGCSSGYLPVEMGFIAPALAASPK